MANVFWRRWLKEYLPSLRDESKPRYNWPLRCVIEVYANAGDKLMRSVKLKTSSSELVIPVDEIVLLEEAMIK